MAMSLEQLAIYAAVALGGWLLRHYGYGATLLSGGKAGLSPAAHSATPAPSATATHIKAEAEAAIQAAVSAAVSDALADLKDQLGVKLEAK